MKFSMNKWFKITAITGLTVLSQIALAQDNQASNESLSLQGKMLERCRLEIGAYNNLFRSVDLEKTLQCNQLSQSLADSLVSYSETFSQRERASSLKVSQDVYSALASSVNEQCLDRPLAQTIAKKVAVCVEHLG